MQSEPAYFMPGSCNPLETNSSSVSYFPDCTDVDNDVTMGGVFPTPTHKDVYEKAADLAVTLKAVFEGNQQIASCGVHFFNSGIATSLSHPGANIAELLPGYTSDGCDWMREINQRNGKPFGTKEDIKQCHPAGEFVPNRAYNSVERSWYRAAASTSGVIWFGPLLRSIEERIPTYLVSKSVFDQM